MHSKKKSNVLVVGNGSGGHFFPSLQVANKLKEKKYRIFYVVSENRIDEKIIEKTDFKYL